MKKRLEVNIIQIAVIYTGLAFNTWFWSGNLDLLLPKPYKQEANAKITTKHYTYVIYG